MNSNLIDNRQIRIFISSTFQDMQDERDYLMKRTFPKLRKFAAERDVTLTELDLRWGITEEEAKTGKVVEICLREIENSIPFFIGIIGNRYGWIPKKEDLGGNVTERFENVNGYIQQGLSVTEMEIQFGVLQRKEDMHAFFFTKEHEGTQDNPKMLSRLKEEIRNSKYPLSTYSSVSNLAEQVELSFITLLDHLFPEKNLSEHKKDQLVQNSFVSALSNTYVKEEDAFTLLYRFATESSSQHLVVTGDSGLGKSALLANWSKAMQGNEDFSTIAYFCSNGGNQNHSHILKYLTEEIHEKFNIAKPEGTEEEQLQKIFDVFALCKNKLIILLDAVNQIAEINQSKMLNWLPIPPPNIKFIFSTLENDCTMGVFESRKYEIFKLHSLSKEQRHKLIVNYLCTFGKKLKEEQIQRITNSNQCKNTLVLKSLLDELIYHGNYKTLDEKINYYLNGATIEEFYNSIITRHETDFGCELVKTVLSLIAVSRNGLTEDEIIHITNVRRIDWSDFFCSFSTHLTNQSGRYVFTHNNITKTVWTKYLANDIEFTKTCRKKIVDEFIEYSNSESMQEIPYQYDKLENWHGLHKYILSPDYLVYCMNYDEVEIGTYWRHILENTANEFSVADYLSEIDKAQDNVVFFMKLIRLCKVLCLEEQMKDFANKLLSLINEKQELASSLVYRTLAVSLHDTAEVRANSLEDMRESVNLAMKSLVICQEQKDIEGEIETYQALSSIYHYMACILNDQDADQYATEYPRKMLELSIGYYGEMHPMVMKAYRDLGIACDDIEKGIAYAKKAIDLAIAIYGPNHPECGRPYHYLGCLYRCTKEWEKALDLFEKACKVWLPAYGKYHEIMISSYGNQSTALYNMGRYEEALACDMNCLDICSHIYEEKNYDYIVTSFHIARIYLEKDLFKEALDFCNEAEIIAIQRNNLEKNRYNGIINSCKNLRNSILCKMKSE